MQDLFEQDLLPVAQDLIDLTAAPAVVEMSDGCICCTVADDFIPTIEALMALPQRPDHFLIETSGLALPKPLLKAFDWPGIRSRITVGDVRKLVGNEAFTCIACHSFKGKKTGSMGVVDITEMGQRLERDWFVSYMLNPQKFSPSTLMPGFWPGGKSSYEELYEGDGMKQIHAIWSYLEEGYGAGQPRGGTRRRADVPLPEHLRPPGAGPPRGLHLHGRPLASGGHPAPVARVDTPALGVRRHPGHAGRHRHYTCRYHTAPCHGVQASAGVSSPGAGIRT